MQRIPAWLVLPSLTVGGTFIACGIGMLICAGVGIEQGRAAAALGIPGVATLAIGAALLRFAQTGAERGLTVRPLTGFLAVTLAWVMAALAGAVPLVAAGTFSDPLAAYFEAVSGFTTTGATLMGEIDPEPDAVKLWRSIMQWLGGVGIVVLVVAIAPVSGPGVQRAFYAETSGITAERLTPRIIDTAKIIAAIYLVLSTAAAIAYAIAGMGLFDAINHAMTTIATAGYSTHTDSIAFFNSQAIEIVAIVFMISGGVNFAFYWRAVRGKPVMPQAAEVIAFLGLLVVAIAAVTLSVEIASNATLREAAFNVTSVVTTTGYTTADFDAWNQFARYAFLLLMCSGACAGSTAGGMKIIRSVLLSKTALQELDRQVRPQVVRVLRFGGHTYSEEVRRAILGFFLVYVTVFLLGSVALAATDVNPVTALSGTASALNLIGPGLGEIGATDNWEALPDFARAVACVLMIAGRLEVFTVVALLAALLRLRRV